MHSQGFQRYPDSTSGVQHTKSWCSIQVKCTTILCKINSNGLENILKKNHCSMSTHLCFSIFWCNSEVICWIFLIVVRLGDWTKGACFITKNVHLCAFYHPWNPQRKISDFMCPTKRTHLQKLVKIHSISPNYCGPFLDLWAKSLIMP